MMETAEQTVAETPKVRGRPFTRGDARIKAGPGRPPRSEIERAAAKLERERRAIFEVVKEELAGDLREALRGGVPLALNTMLRMIDDERIDPAVRLQACRDYCDRALGKPVVSQQIATVDLTPVDKQALQDRISRIMRVVSDQ
jgi:hypothetical protein